MMNISIGHVVFSDENTANTIGAVGVDSQKGRPQRFAPESATAKEWSLLAGFFDPGLPPAHGRRKAMA